MRFDFRIGAVLATAVAGVAAGCSQEGGNYYCDSVKGVSYNNFGGSGSYDRVSSMDNGQCQFEKLAYGGGMGPFSGEVREMTDTFMIVY